MTYDGLSNLNMEYNHMDLPRKISSGNTTLVNYSYLADGNKISSLKPSGEGLVYRGPFVYRKSADGTIALESVVCPEGRLTPDKALLYIKDHLGSIRYVIDGNTGARLEKSDYTDYGAHSGSASSAGSNITLRDHFTGQEDQMPDFNIPYSDHGARQYNPGIFRWMVPDPLSEKYYGQSVYNYCGGNPMSFVDRDGRFIETIWDIANLALDVESLSQNVRNRDVGGTALDAVSLAIDAAAVLIPGVPGGTGTALKAVRGAESVSNAVQTSKVVEKSANVGKKSLHELATIGQEAHRQIEKGLHINYGALKEQAVLLPNSSKRIRKDAIMPDGTMVIIKPDTPTGHTAAERRIKLLKENFENPKFSTIFYDPTDIKYLPGSPTYIGPLKK